MLRLSNIKIKIIVGHYFPFMMLNVKYKLRAENAKVLSLIYIMFKLESLHSQLMNFQNFEKVWLYACELYLTWCSTELLSK